MWSEQKMNYFRKMFPKYNLGFLLLDTCMNVYLNAHDMSEFDYIVVSSDFYGCYIVFSASLHIGQTSISLKSTQKYCREKKTAMVSKTLHKKGLYEKCLVIPYGQENNISKDLDQWFTDVRPINDNGNMTYGFYDVKTKSIKANC